MEEIAIINGITTFDVSQKLMINGGSILNTKMHWIKWCPNFVVEKNGFEVCHCEHEIELAYCQERVPFSFKNGADYVLVSNLKRLKRGSVYQSWVAPQIHELATAIQKYPNNIHFKEAYNELLSRL